MSALQWILVILFSLSIYMIPTAVAIARSKQNVVAIGVVNFFFGCTMIGWVLALVWACLKDKRV